MNLTDELERLTPERVEADYDALARRGRRQRDGQRVGAAVAVVVLAVGAFTAVPSLRGTAPVDVEFAAAPAGQWRQVSDLPLGPRLPAFSGVLSDGRVLVFGGQDDIDGAGELDEGAVWDPADGTWTLIEASPLGLRAYPQVALAEDRLLVFGGGNSPTDGGIWDAATGQWTEIPGPPPGVGVPRVAAWDGTQLVVMGGADPEGYDDPANVASWTTAGGWRALSPAPFPTGRVTTALSGDLLAAVSEGTAGGIGFDPASGYDLVEANREAVTSGAVLDLVSGRWTAIPAAAVPAAGTVAIAWIDSGLAVVGTLGGGSGAAVVDPVSLTITPLALPAVDVAHATVSAPQGQPLTAHGPTAQGLAVAALLPDGTWTAAVPGNDVIAQTGQVIATTTGGSNPNYESPLQAWRWTGRGWATLAPAPVINRSNAAVAVTDKGLLVAGGWSERAARPGEEPDGIPSEGERPGPYVIDVHADAWLLELP